MNSSMHFKLVAISLVPIVVACTSPVFTPKESTAIRSEMEQQEQAWNRGDIPGFMAAYSDSICFFGTAERTCGKAVVTARYEKRYPDRESMGHLDFDQVEILGAGADHAWCTGTWRLLRSSDTLSGGFSLFWMRTPVGWRILRDHTY